ncbi:PH domain-containing protein [Catellatospora tritici]|uniref:PH domain-containing protein n=1 Tax=Catellatospora tritici TaxID=2851566 RepID=UPI001C2DCC48|nr:PH domain-containing protein [Catellatospora tritici]MBV1855357.1 PH domain-containing protein [Catellatospora tritici]
MAGRLVLRNRRNYLAVPFLTLIGAFACVLAAAAGGAIGAVVGLLLFMLSVVVSWRLARMSVAIQDRGLVVRNPLRSHELTWEEIDSFTYPANNPFYPITVNLISGRRIGLVALDHETTLFAGRAQQHEQRHVDVLAAALRDARARSVGASTTIG